MVSKRYLVQEWSWTEKGEKIFGWHILDKETGKTASGTQPSTNQRALMKKKRELNKE